MKENLLAKERKIKLVVIGQKNALKPLQENFLSLTKPLLWIG